MVTAVRTAEPQKPCRRDATGAVRPVGPESRLAVSGSECGGSLAMMSITAALSTASIGDQLLARKCSDYCVDGLIVRQPFADLIASGQKTWELRRRPLRLSGRFYILAASKPDRPASPIAQQRLGVAVTTAEQTGLLGPLSVAQLAKHVRHHRASVEQLRTYAGKGQLYAVTLRVTRLKQTRRYRMRPGAVTIVRDVELI